MSAHTHDHGHDRDHGHERDQDHAGHSHGSGGHHHHEPPAGFDGAFALGSGLNAAFVAAEAVFGLGAHSVALLADAAHMRSKLAWTACTCRGVSAPN